MPKRVVLFQKPGCPDCGRAREWLWNQPNVEVLERDILMMPPGLEFLDRHIQADGDRLRRYLNKRCGAYRRHGLARALPDRGELIQLLDEEPALIRRPLITRGAQAVFGMEPDLLRALLA